MRFEEYLYAAQETALLNLIGRWNPQDETTSIPKIFHEKLLSQVRDFSLVGGMPEAVQRFISQKNFLGYHSIHQSILDTYRSDFGKFHKRVPIERIERVFSAIPTQIGKKWVHARINAEEKAKAIDQALDLLCKAKVAHRVYHSSGNGVPLAAEQKDNLFKILFLDIGLVNSQLGLRITDLVDSHSFAHIHEGVLAEQWIGQHLLDLRDLSQPPIVFYWVREKTGSLAEVDYLIQQGARVYPVEVKAGPSSKVKSLQVFLSEKHKNSPIGIHFSNNFPHWNSSKNILELPFYLVEQVPRILNLIKK
jgi:predicted AAA+ superfamily ATPase